MKQPQSPAKFNPEVQGLFDKLDAGTQVSFAQWAQGNEAVLTKAVAQAKITALHAAAGHGLPPNPFEQLDQEPEPTCEACE